MKKALKILIAINAEPTPLWQDLLGSSAILHVRTANEVEAHIRQTKFDAIILDRELGFPEDGRLLRSCRNENPVAFIILTALEKDFEYVRMGLLHQANDFLLRPLTPDDMLSTIGRIRTHAHPAIFLEDGLSAAPAAVIGKPDFSERLRMSLHSVMEGEPDPSIRSLKMQFFYMELLDRLAEAHPWLKSFISRYECMHSNLSYLDPIDPDIAYSSCITLGNRLNAFYCMLCPPASEEQIASVIEYFLTRIQNPLSQKELAEHFYLSASTLSEHFRNAVGMTYTAYTRQVKILRSAYLLRNTGLSLREITEPLGFKDIPYFTRIFHELIGLTVSEYRTAPLDPLLMILDAPNQANR